MNYYKNMEIESQEITDPELFRVVAWDLAHRGTLTPAERLKIMSNKARFERALMLWENETTPMPKSARHHVAELPYETHTKLSVLWSIGWSLVGVALVVGLTLLAVNL